MKEKKSINLIWQTSDGDETNFEKEYITNFLFSKFEKIEFFDNKSYQTILDNSVIIYSNNSNEVSEDFLNYIQKFVKGKFKFYLLHLSNENLSHNFEYYNLANHVFRNYYDSNIQLSNCTFIPLGFKSGFLNGDTFDDQENNKKYDFTFIGQPKSDRFDLINLLKEKENVFLHTTNQWNCPTALTQEECGEIYKKTKFVPCPMGWSHPDSFRIMEALEWNSIPILKRYGNLDYFEKVWGDSPLPIVNSWEEIFKLNLHIDDYTKLHKKTFNWYSNFKKDLSEKIYTTINKN